MTGTLPRIYSRDQVTGRELVTRREIAHRLGYSQTSMATVMGRAPDRWPAPVAMIQMGRPWVWLWDWAEVEASAPPATAAIRRGAPATISQDDGLLTCLECGDQRRWRALGRHLQARHDMTADQYRAVHRLPASAALECDGLRQQGRERMLLEPHRTSHLQPYRDAPRLDAMREEAIASIRATQGYETVRKARAQARRAGVRAMVSARADQLAALVQAHGYTDPRQAVEQTRALSVRDAAAATGLSKTTIRRWRTDPAPLGDVELAEQGGPEQ